MSATTEPTIRHKEGHRTPQRLWPKEVALLRRLAGEGASLHWRRLILAEEFGYPPSTWFLRPGDGDGDELEDVDADLALNLLHDGYLSGPHLCHGGRSAYTLNDYGREALARLDVEQARP